MDNKQDLKDGYDTLSEAIKDLQDKGYTIDLNLADDGIESKHLKKTWDAGQIEVDKAYRFEGMSNPDDNSVLYAINTKGGEKGLLVDAYGAYSGQISKEMIQKLKIEH